MKQKQESSKQRTYPNLFKKFAYDNFNVIVEAVEKQFSTLFNLSVLEEAAGDEILSSEPYFCWFSSLIPYLKEKRAEDEIVAELAFQLNNDICIEFYKGKFLFVADKKGLQGNQLGELERSLSGKATRPVEPFSFLDIIRLVGRAKPKETDEKKSGSSSKASSGQRVSVQRPEKEKKIGVFSLTHLHSIHNIKQEKPEAKGLEGFTDLIININRNPQDVPKWVSVEFDNKKGTIFCEARLLDSEKDEIENIINPYVDSLEYDPNGGKADGGISSGHVAVRRLERSAVSSKVKEKKENFWMLCHQLRLGVRKAETGKFETKYFSEDMAFVSSQIVPDQNRQKLLSVLEDFFTYTGFYRHDINLTAKKMVDDLKNKWKENPSGYWDHITEKVYDEDPFCIANKGVSSNFFINAIENAPNHTVQMNDLVWHETHKFSDTVVKVFNASQNFKEVTIVAEGTTEETIPHPDKEKEKKGYETNIFKAKAATSGKKNILSPEQFGYLTEAMEYNTHVEKFSVQLTQEKNESIDELNLQFSPRLARNRWLNANQYCQPLMGNHWRFAVKKWLNYLLDHPGVLSGETGSSVRFFKEVVEGMGVLGLKEFLSYLSQEHSLVEKMLGGTGLPFYAACPDYEINAYTKALKEHLERREYFPFESLGFRYVKGNTEGLLDLLSELNRLSQVGTIHVMVSAEERKSPVFHDFLKTLGRRTADEHWTTVLVVEGLSGGVCPTEEQDLRNTYRHVNNMILEHRRGQKAAKLVESMRGKIYVEKLTSVQANPLLTTNLSSLPSSSSSASSAFSAASSDFSSSSYSSSSSSRPSYLDPDAKQIIESKSSLSTTSVKPIGKKWPLQGGGAVQLQVQQQQQVQQQRQVHQQHKLTRTVLMDELPAETDLVNYDTVEAVFGAHYQELLKQFPEMNSSSLPIQRESATFLQNFFETCIGADPKVKARYVIRHMTKESFTTLLRNYRQLSSGFNPEDQWPKGFYMQWNRLGEAILCYHPELGYLKEPTPLTLQLRRRMPAAVAWEGDFRQFDFAHYLKQDKVVVDQKALELMASFAALQPGTPWPTFDQFLIDHPNLNTLLGPEKAKVTEYWPIFYQAYQYAGQTGLNACLAPSSVLPRSDAQKALTFLFASDVEVLSLIKTLDLNKTHAVALGQLYYALGKDSVKVFLTQMNVLRNRLGPTFFSKFRERFLTPCENFSGFFTTSCFETLNQMIDALTENAYPEIGELWDRISQAHVAAVGLESPEVLWKGFWYFMEGLSAEGVTLSGASLRKLSNANGLIWMHRVLACVQRIPEQDEKALFLGKLNDFALKYGDLPYAVERDGIRRPTKEGLRLVNFEMAKPTYAPSLEGVFSWTEDELDVLTQRALATTPFEPNEHRALSAYFEELSKDTTRPKETIPALLTIVLLTSNLATSTSAVEFLKVLEKSSLLISVAKVLHEAVYAKRDVKLAVSMSCLSALLTHLDFTQVAWNSIPVDYRPLFLESVMLLHNRGAMGDLKGLLALVQTSFEPAVEVSAEKLVETAETNNPTSSAEVVKSDEENEKKAAQKAYSLKLVRG